MRRRESLVFYKSFNTNVGLVTSAKTTPLHLEVIRDWDSHRSRRLTFGHSNASRISSQDDEFYLILALHI
jgi:hypothetical protein